MARFTRIEVALEMKRSAVVPVFYNPDPDICFEVASACYRGGLRVFEFTNRGDHAHEVFSWLNRKLTRECPGMITGAGSVMDGPAAVIYMQSGANFIVSPGLDEETARLCNARKLLWIPGCGSVTEIIRAESLGAEIVKIFPASEVGGPGFVKAVRGPRPWTSIMPTGGVEPDEENLSAWFRAGVWCVGMGSGLITKDIIENRDFGLLENRVAGILKMIAGIKGGTEK